MANQNQINSIVSKELTRLGISLADLNKRSNLAIKEKLIRRIMPFAMLGSTSKKETFSAIRQSGIKSSNKIVREIYSTQSTTEKITSKYAARLKRDYRPNPNKIPRVEFGDAKGNYLYVATVFLDCSNESNKNYRSINSKGNAYTRYKNEKGKWQKKTHSVIKMGRKNKYNKISEYAFWSNRNLSRNEIDQLFLGIFLGERLINNFVVDTSNYYDVNFRVCDLVAFSYVKTLRA